MESLMGGLFAAVLLPAMLLGAVPLFIYVYVILRWRAGSAEEPGIGSYGLVLMFRLIALLLGLTSISLLLYAVMSESDLQEMTRICWPVLVAALLFLAIQFVVGRTIGHADRFVAARRLFGGGLVAISGIVTLSALTAFLVTMWEKMPDYVPGNPRFGDHADKLKAFGSWLVCFGTVYFASALRMALGARAKAPPPLTPP